MLNSPPPAAMWRFLLTIAGAFVLTVSPSCNAPGNGAMHAEASSGDALGRQAAGAASGQDLASGEAFGFVKFDSNTLTDDDGDGLPDWSGPAATKEGSAGKTTTPQDAFVRRLVHEGALVLAVADAPSARAQLRTITESLGGYVSTERDASLVLRIPAERWREALDAVSKAGREISRNIEVQDVTEQYVDLELRLKNSRALRDRLEQLLQKADSVKAALEVEKELTRVRLDIELLEANLRTLSQRVSFATLSIELRQLSQASRSSAALPYSWLNSLGVENLLGRGGAR